MELTFQRDPIPYFLFSDERKGLEGGRWNYLCMLALKESGASELMADLAKIRNLHPCDGPYKFSAMGKTPNAATARWGRALMDLVVEESDRDNPRFRVSVLGLDTEKLDHERFGGDLGKGPNYANLYNRFYRSQIRSLFNFHHPSDQIEVRAIIHDSEGNLEKHDFFDFHSIREVSRREPRIVFKNDRIEFIRSDHRLHDDPRNQNRAHVIQFVDAIVGAISSCFHPGEIRSKIPAQGEMANQVYPLLREPEEEDSAYPRGKPRSSLVVHSAFPRQERRAQWGGEFAADDFYRLSLRRFEDRESGQGDLGF